MADIESQKTAAHLDAENVVVVSDVLKSTEKTTPPPVPESEEEPVKAVAAAEEEEEKEEAVESVDKLGLKSINGDEKVKQYSSLYEEETTKVSDLPDAEKKALQELKQLVEEALSKHELLATQATKITASPETEVKEEERNIEEESKPEPVIDEAPPKPESDEGDKKIEEEKKVEDKVFDEKTTASFVSDAVEAVDDDGAKTVEAIEETIVAVSCPPHSSSVHANEEALAGEASKESEEPNHVVSLDGQLDGAQLSPPEEVFIWGIPLLADERSDVVLLKFLRARDFKVKDAFAMLKTTLQWRKEFGIDELIDQDLGGELEKVVFMHGFDKERHPVCYNVFGEFQNKQLYQKTFSDEEKRLNFLKWRIQFLEKSIRKLDFSPGGISTIVQVNDLKNSPGPGKWELRQATKQALQLLQDNYPEFVAKQVFINVPWWYLAVNRMISPFLTQRTRSKFVFAGPSKSAETLFRYIAGEQVPVKYGGLSKEGEFDTTDVATEITLKPAAKHTVEFPVTETCLLRWEVRVVGWEVRYGAEFIPDAKENYTVIIQKARKVSSAEEPVVCNSFKIGEPGKVVLTIDNSTSKKKKLLYRLKTKPSSSSSD